MSDQNENVDEFTPNADELVVLLHREEVKAGLENLGEDVSVLIQDVLDSVAAFLKKLG